MPYPSRRALLLHQNKVREYRPNARFTREKAVAEATNAAARRLRLAQFLTQL